MSETWNETCARFGVTELTENLCGDLGWCCVVPEGLNAEEAGLPGGLRNWRVENETEFPDIVEDIREDYRKALALLKAVENPPEEIVLVYGIVGNGGACFPVKFENWERCVEWALTKSLCCYRFLNGETVAEDEALLKAEMPGVIASGFYTDGENTLFRCKFAEVLAAFEKANEF